MPGLYSSTIGKKVAMALSGVLLFGFVVGHLAGNLKVFQGAEKFDAYAHFLREIGAPVLGHNQALWIARAVLLAALVVHAASAAALERVNRRARDVPYKRHDPETFSYASRTMRWGGVLLLAYVVYHLMHLTFGSAHPSFDATTPYANVVAGFRSWPVVVAYLVAIVMLGLHLHHGLWSATRTLALDRPFVRRWRRPFAVGTSALIVAGYAAIPLAVLAGLVR